MKFRKKPVVIEAHQIPALNDPHTRELPIWLVDALCNGTVTPLDGSGGVIIKTLEGDHRGDVGDWIIRGIKGELYPCKPDIFAATYEPAE
jgi:hypothetical protein